MKPIEVKELKEYDLNSIFPGNLSAQIRESLEDQNAELVRSLGLRTDAIQVYKKNRVWKIDERSAKCRAKMQSNQLYR